MDIELDLSIPEGLPPEAVAQLIGLQQELEEGDITRKGFRKRRDQIIAVYAASTGAEEVYVYTPSMAASITSNRKSGVSVYSWDQPANLVYTASSVSMPEGWKGIKTAEALEAVSGPLQSPIPPVGIPEYANADPLDAKIRLNTFDNLPSILRHRGKANAEIVAFQALDARGRELQVITWSKLASKSERVAQLLREQPGLFRGDRVCLVYTQKEPLEFVVALMGCFLAGIVAVPVMAENISALHHIVHATQCQLALTSDQQHKIFHKQHGEQLARLKNLKWLKTNEGTYPLARKNTVVQALQVPDLAYIDFNKSPTGELRGVVMSHRTILHQMTCLTAMLQSRDTRSNSQRNGPDRLLCSLDTRRSTGLILGVLLTIYAGNCTYFIAQSAMSVPGLYAHVASRNNITILVSDYPALKQVCYNYQSAPEATRGFSKRHKINLKALRWCLIDAATVDVEFQMVLGDRWLKPLGNKFGRDIVAPMLTLVEHGGMVIAMRDWLSTRETDDFEPRVLHISREALRYNRIEFTSPGPNALTVGSFGFSLPDATLAIVDPNTQILAEESTVGELWIDSPSLSGGFWGLAKDTDFTFHARCFDREGVQPLEFLRTDLLGFVFDGNVYVLGLLEDQLVIPKIIEQNESDDPAKVESATGYHYYYSQHLMESIMRSIEQVYDGCAFEVTITGQKLPVVVLETPVAVKNVQSQVKETRYLRLLDGMCEQVLAVLHTVHKLNVYCVVITAPKAAPRIMRSGRPDIAKILTRRQFNNGSMPSAYVKFNAETCLAELPCGPDVKGGIWSPAISYLRTESLGDTEKQYSGVDMRNNVQDDRTSQNMDQFRSLIEVFQWRVSRQPDELAYLTVSAPQVNNTTNRETTWKKLDQKVAAVYTYLKEHLHAEEGNVALLMYTHGEHFVSACLACFMLGVTVIPISPINIDHLDEDISALIDIYKTAKVTFVLGNHETYNLMDDRQVTQNLRSRKVTLGKLHNTAKIKDNAMQTCKNIKLKHSALRSDAAALVWLYWNADHEYEASRLNHANILGMCKIQKETCQMSSTKPIIGCVRSVSGLGFLYTCCLGIYIGASTILVSPVDYANNPSIFYLTASRYKVKDGYATTQMLEHACNTIKPKGYSLAELANLVVPTTERIDTELVKAVRLSFGQADLETTAINLAYGPSGNPMVATRSYMLVENIDLWLDPIALRQGYVSVVNPANCPEALHLQDSGMVPINTQVAIVNPETKRLCRTGEYGEIWVVSDGNQAGYYKMEGSLNKELMRAVISDGDPRVEYMRTGDFGFLHSVTKGAEEMQVLFVLGPIKNTIEINGLNHFVIDVEASVNKSHTSILASTIFIAGDLSVIVVETSADLDHLASLVPVVADALLENHQFIVNIVAFVGRGDIPRSRLNEIQRKRLTTAYVSGQLPLLGQFAIRGEIEK